MLTSNCGTSRHSRKPLEATGSWFLRPTLADLHINIVISEIKCRQVPLTQQQKSCRGYLPDRLLIISCSGDTLSWCYKPWLDFYMQNRHSGLEYFSSTPRWPELDSHFKTTKDFFHVNTWKFKELSGAEEQAKLPWRYRLSVSRQV